MTRLWIGFLGFVLMFTSCSNDEGNGIGANPPVFKSSIPENNAKDVSVSTQIEVSFNEVVYVVDDVDITVNNEATEVIESYTKIIINTTLEKGEDYVVLIPKGSLINMDDVPLADDIQFTFSTEEGVSINIDEDPVCVNPSTQAVNVYNFLLENYGKKSLSATHANVNWNINEAEWVKQHTDKYPAMNTMDYIHIPYASEGWIDYSDLTVVKDWWDNNGLLCANWHWIVPPYEGAPLSYDYTYKPEETTFKASNVLVEGTWENEIAKADLEKLADYLKLLQENDIPLIWRPFHEAAGNIYEFNNGTAWFWWGADGADTYKDLWIYMFEYFESRGLNNLIWVWTTQTKDNEFYPGDDYVDIIGRDIYNNSDPSDIDLQFNAIQDTYPNKMVTLSEMGNISKLSDQWNVGAKWSYFMPWYDYDRTNDMNSDNFTGTTHEHADANWWIDAMNQSYVITRDQMPDLK
ncbi:glycosyl hydrolase [Carboxylicivirga linearis]|uniref:Ig-like domain-containing protein n=1 Tax=Carboxylicivirga linearis TaxID=1628157 RepID=A0ABS5JWV2_9BACT|nr:glycosyl hydrolase [Carboxylicivirga linearis]MBS2099363.1 Ig-like domain-containing protein [Carboxylicivirga linearis]